MKKRILALALAGTTAFSVFGAAMSANAATTVVYWNGNSSHIGANDNAYYQSYTAAGDIHWTTEAATATLAWVHDGNTSIYTVGTPNTTTINNRATIAQGATLYVTDPTNFGTAQTRTYYDVRNVSALPGYYATLTDFMTTGKGYQKAEVNADKASFTVGGTTYYLYTDAGETAYYAFTQQEITNGLAGDYVPFGVTQTGSMGYVAGDNANTTDVYYTVNNGTISHKVEVAILYNYTMNSSLASVVTNNNSSTSNTYYIADCVNLGVPDATNYFVYDGTDGHDICYVTAYTGATNTIWTDAGYTALSPVTGDIDAVMDEEVQNGVVYLYDYYYDETYPSRIDVDTFAEGWADGSLANDIKGNSADTSGVIEPETGYSYRSVRGDVLDAWENFLDDLGIADASAREITAWAENIYANYAYTYYDATVITDVSYNATTGVWSITFEDAHVDLYNFGDLLEDILELAPASNPDLNSVQTSEFVYLMQQYEKYTSEGFVDVNPVETDDWGDLLVALAEAPTEDEFATTNAYRRYTNAVEDLVEQYEEADTAAAVAIAEEDLYNFVTSYRSTYKYSTQGDTSDLYTAIDSTVFNYNWRTAYSNTVPADVYLGKTETDGTTAVNVVDDNYNDTAWALYPQDDYYGTVSGSYPGVDTTIANVTAEYYWFYNVYDLAYNVYTSNKYQSTLDLMAETLNDAVDALTPYSRSTARASEILGAEEANDDLADLVETDYVTSMWSNRNKIYNFITDRVSNDEIGSTGTTNAEDIASRTAYLMGHQQYQTVVTRSDINSVSTAMSEAETALEALRADEDNYNAAQANALENAIADCEYIIDIYNGDYATRGSSQTVNGTYNGAVGDKDQILKSDITDAVDAVDAAINFANIIQGWSQNSDGDWMYGTTEGYLNDGWHQVDGGQTWFYFNEDGTAKQSEWWQDTETGYWYWFNSNCGAAVGWAQVDGDWYYFKGDNHMKTGWERVEGNWYYLSSSGRMVTGWCQIDGTWYYFSQESNALGQMLYSTVTPDGYKVDANGALVE